MRIYKSESELAASLQRKFSKYSDFTIVQEEPVRLKDKNIRLDIVIKYGGKPVACVELKTDKDLDHFIDHVEVIRKYSGIRFCFAVVNDSYKYYESSKGILVDKNEDDILKMLLDAVNHNAVKCNEIKKPFSKLIRTRSDWGEYGKTLLKYIEKGELKRCGKYVFLEEGDEKNFFRELLTTTNERMPKLLCRYTSAKSFYLCLQNGFRISSVEAMNDELETKVIDKYPNLQSVQTELSEYLYNGFILSFSKIERKDKLLQWYMYGDQAKGVCLTIEPKSKPNVFWAPVVYIPKKQETNGQTLLDFLNELLGMEIDNLYWFKLRYWHYWKFFFKYDFYQDEGEVRMLIIQRDKGDIDWSEEFKMPYHYISKKKDNMPFEIKGVMFGPRCNNTDNLQNYVFEVLGNSIELSHSEIIGYR